ncbi:Uncharacterized protein SCF082_LOCUS11629 [Durusdinium trenchii]|uniref:Glycosyltransferase family 92 protein n=1 Tax=Durusdinium trenchii TaxID=1381693 RepID=A0ABP0JEF7_9DINO
MRHQMHSLALALAAWAVAACAEDCSSLLQARAPVAQYTVVEQQEEIVWNIARGTNYTLQFFSVVPTFGADGNYIALLHEFDPVLSNYVGEHALYCSDASGVHKTQLRVYGREKGIPVSLIFHCDWPEEQSELENFEVFLENEEGKTLGKVAVNHNTPSAKHQSVACVRDVFMLDHLGLDRVNETLAYKHLVEWLEFHLYHGMDHFFVYTFGTVDDVYEEILKPYLLAGAATRIHFKTRPDFHRQRQYWSMTDCLYRSKNHATWVMPTVDRDEYFRVTGPNELFGTPSVPKNYFHTVWDAIVRHEGKREEDVKSITFDLYRFELPSRDELTISSTMRQAETQAAPFSRGEGKKGWPKFVYNVKNANSVYVHWVHSSVHGTEDLHISPSLGVANHYRSPFDFDEHEFPANVSDTTLQTDVVALEEALAARFQRNPREFLKYLSHKHPAPDVPESNWFAATDRLPTSWKAALPEYIPVDWFGGAAGHNLLAENGIFDQLKRDDLQMFG